MKQIVCASDYFKGSLTANEACEAMKQGILKVTPDLEVKTIPISDGGEGLLESLVVSTNGTIETTKVQDPLGRTITAEYGILGDGITGVVEMARASGLLLLDLKERDPAITSTYGTGQLISKLLDKGCKKIIIGIGGSATNDGGLGLFRALGGKDLDKNNNELDGVGKELREISSLDNQKLDERVTKTKFIAACDVDNPLIGKKGAAYVFASQKGANDELVQILDKGLKNYAEIVKKDLGVTVEYQAGSGAAGGLGAGILAFLGGDLVPGIDLVLDTINFEKRINNADLVLTGEGKLDKQTSYGKVPVGVAKRTKAFQIPVIALCGEVGDGTENLHKYGINAYFSIADGPTSPNYMLENASELLSKTTEQVIRMLNLNHA
ncbi:glycerate kinase [Natranaerobius trueperi]|uniref:Glycerate kinase n=1 Tax=Natranaerobius trueperi TaxID=759412 RepID=A0A226BXS5_9FIRM|nr:glycerate kinase [Natranaerobius trueperi]OWZ82917.1 glycerate kinase [Natranaerobius trueperi]